jgi:hypothetical protein
MRYHPRFDSNAWVWPTGPIVEEIRKGNIITGGSDILDTYQFDTSDTAKPWFVVYQDKRGGISAATWVIDDVSNETYAFYNTRLFDLYDGVVPLKDLMAPLVEGMPFSPREKTMADVWNTLTNTVSPSYESFDDIDEMLIAHNAMSLIYLASHFIPQSINKLHIGD